MLKTLVLGGYGNFGARICKALAGDPAIELHVGGRNGERAAALAAALGHGAQGVAIDLAATDLAAKLRKLGIGLVVHTAGPFQQQAYRVAEAAAAAGAHYIDLADGRRFVCDFSDAMDGAFRSAGRTAVCGASTVPALSTAVVDRLADGWRRIDAIDICIAPAQTAPRGRATLAAVLSYCGEPIKVWDGGRWQTQRGWANPVQVHFARMRPRLGALCDIPDLELLPQRYHVTTRVSFRAALEVGLSQRIFALLATLRGARLLPKLAPLAGVLNATARSLDFMGSALGGMVVRVDGVDAVGQPARRAWHIAADHDHGPEIPCMAAILLARRLAHDEAMPAGAFSAMGLLQLAEFEPEFARWHMATDTLDDMASP
ncbi:saccharopine dehydrogenase NADP-binding domain-containing protein [soil metagenome]